MHRYTNQFGGNFGRFFGGFFLFVFNNQHYSNQITIERN